MWGQRLIRRQQEGEMGKKEKRIVKVARFRILKPAGEISWDELGEILRDVRYRVFRLANLAVSEAYLNFHLWRTGHSENFQTGTIGQLNRTFRKALIEDDKIDEKKCNRFFSLAGVGKRVTETKTARAFSPDYS